MVGAPLTLSSSDAPIVSLSGKHWRMRMADARQAAHIAQRYALDPVIAHILAAREFDLDKIDIYLQPKLRDWIPDPSIFKDMDLAVARLTQAILKKEKVAIFGDYDVDGATSSALMIHFLRAVGIEPTLYIPDRVTEGYGPNVNAFRMLHESGHDLIVTVDCGVVAFEPMRYAADNKIDVVILDHHMATPELPPACAIVNPNRMDETAGFHYLAACGVTFLTLVALSTSLRTHNITPPDLMGFLDLVALGTVCDVVPLVDLNRAFVCQGLKIMAQKRNEGLQALCARADLHGPLTAYHAGFILGPRINAGGRISTSQLGATLLSTTDPNVAATIADQLEVLNRERQELEKISVEHAIGMVAHDEDKFTHAITLAHRDWHPGVIGLIAARIKEQFQRPTCIIALDEHGKGKASARSIANVDLGALILQARMEGFIAEGGGHAMAAGFSLREEQIPAFHDFMTAQLTKKFGPALPPPEITIDAQLALAAVNMDVIKQLQQMEPFGAGNASPKVMLAPVHLQRITIIKDKHVRLQLSDRDNLQRQEVMFFNLVNTPLYQKLQKIPTQQELAILGSLKLNSWQGREQAQFIADDIALL